MYNPHDTVRNLRQNQTEAEKLLWPRLRNYQLGCKFCRQNPVGKYIVDFVCVERGLIIELDGGQHTSERDQQRADDLEKMGYRILRFWNNDVFENMDGVYLKIKMSLQPE